MVGVHLKVAKQPQVHRNNLEEEEKKKFQKKGMG